MTMFPILSLLIFFIFSQYHHTKFTYFKYILLIFIFFKYFLNSNVFSLLHDKTFQTDEKNPCIFYELLTL